MGIEFEEIPSDIDRPLFSQLGKGRSRSREKKMEKEKEEVKEQCHHGNEMTEEELEEHFKAFQEIEESIGLVMKNGEDL